MSITRSDLVGLATVKDRVLKLGASSKEVQAEIHLLGCSTLEHMQKHGDSTGATMLMNALPNGQRVKALALWFRHFSNGAVNMTEKKGTWSCKLKPGRKPEDFDIDGAIATTFADLTTERDPVTLTLEKFVKSLERTANNEEVFDGTDTPKVSPAVRNLAAQYVKAYRAATGVQAEVVPDLFKQAAAA